MNKKQFEKWTAGATGSCVRRDYEDGWRYDDNDPSVIEVRAEDLADALADELVLDQIEGGRRAAQKIFVAIFKNTYVAEMRRLSRVR